MGKIKRFFVFLLVIPCCLLTSCTDSKEPAETDGFTAEYRDFLAARGERPPSAQRDNFDGYQFTLENGRLCILGTDGDEIWRTHDEWYAESFRIGDVNRDGALDVALIVWKSYSYGSAQPARKPNESAAVRCHLFVYSVKDNRVKSLWCTSNLPRPIYSFEFRENGQKTPTRSGVLLITHEGAYTEDYSQTESVEYTYAWDGWGFSPVETPPDPSEDAVQTASLAFVGDLMCHEAQNRDAFLKGGGAAYDFSYAFQYIAPYITAADYAVGNLETTIIQDGNWPSDFPRFGAPSAYAEAIKAAGFNLVTTANNHALDFGKDGLVHTLQALDEIGLQHTGTYANEADSQNITVINVNGITFAILSYTRGTNGIPLPPDMPWCVKQADTIQRDIAQAKTLNPDVILVMPHMGMEYETSTRPIFKDQVRELFEAGADIVLATHPHVLQPVEFITVTDADGTDRHCLAAYSLGNFISSQRIAPRDAGMIVNLSFKKAGGQKATLDSIDLMPVWVKFTAPDGSYDITVLPVSELGQPEFKDVVNGLKLEDIRRIDEVKSEFAGMFPDAGSVSMPSPASSPASAG